MWQVSISTTAEAEEAVACLLERTFQKPATIYCHADTGASVVTSYPARLAQSPILVRRSLRQALQALRQCGLDFAPGKVSVKLLPRKNWAESWKRHFKPIEIGKFLLIKPGWSRRRPRPGQRALILDPGLSFGTGHHPTTLFCLEQLARGRRAGEKQSFLDIGTGSGILAIAAVKLGYSPVEAFDHDANAVRVSRENVKKNGVGRRLRPVRKDLTRLKTKAARRYDVICANLMADLLISEAAKICARLKPGGKLLVAGILKNQFADVQNALQRFGLRLELSRPRQHWRSGQFSIPPAAEGLV